MMARDLASGKVFPVSEDLADRAQARDRAEDGPRNHFQP
jgi:hypothetical protein